MDDISEVWRWVKTIAGVVLLVLVALYAIRCVSTFQIVTLDQFDRFVRELAHTIFA